MNRIAKKATLALAITATAPLTSLAADAEAKPEPQWESSAAAGLTVTKGNSESILGTIDFATAKKWERHELSFGASLAYGQTTIDVPDENNPGQTREKDDVTANSVKGFGQYNHLFSERFYGYGRVEALHDDVAKVDYRLTLSPGAGYYFIKEPRVDLSAEVGPSYIIERLDGHEDTYLALRVGEKFNYKLSDRARIWQTAEFLPQVDDFENYILNFELGIEASLTEKLSLRSYIQDTYDNVPAEGRKRNDLKWVTAIAYKF
jgi:Putative salt-induced outer membrane protein